MNFILETIMANYDYNKKFNEIRRLGEKYKASENSTVRAKYDKEITDGLKELKQNINIAGQKAKEDFKQFKAKFEAQMGAFNKWDEDLALASATLLGGNISNLNEDEVQAEMRFAADSNALEKEYPNYKKFNNAEEYEDENEKVKKVIQCVHDIIKLEDEYEHPNQHLFSDQDYIHFSEEDRHSLLNQLDDLDKANAEEEREERIAALKKSPSTLASVGDTTKELQEIVNIEKAAKNNAVTELKETLSEQRKTTQDNQEREYLANLEKQMNDALQSHAHKKQESSSAVQQAKVLLNESNELNNIAKTARNTLGKSDEVRNNPRKKQTASALNRFIENMSSIAQDISACFNKLKNTFGNTIRNFFTSSSSPSNKVSPPSDNSSMEKLLARQQKLENDLIVLNKKLNASTRKSEVDYLKQMITATEKALTAQNKRIQKLEKFSVNCETTKKTLNEFSEKYDNKAHHRASGPQY